MRSGPVLTSLKPYRVVMVLAGTACWSTGCISFSLKELVEVSLLVQGSHKTDLDYFLMFSLTHMEARESVPLFCTIQTRRNSQCIPVTLLYATVLNSETLMKCCVQQIKNISCLAKKENIQGCGREPDAQRQCLFAAFQKAVFLLRGVVGETSKRGIFHFASHRTDICCPENVFFSTFFLLWWLYAFLLWVV